MASWTAMTDLSTGDLFSEADYDAIKGNIEYNLTPNQDQVKDTNGPYASASTTWVDVHATNVALAVTTNGGHLRIEFSVQWSHSAVGGHCTIGILVDGVEQGGSDGVYDAEANAIGRLYEAQVCHTVIAPSGTAHTIKLQMKTNAGTLTLFGSATRPVILTAVES